MSCYREPRRVEATFFRISDIRRLASRYDNLTGNDAFALALAAIIIFWC